MPGDPGPPGEAPPQETPVLRDAAPWAEALLRFVQTYPGIHYRSLQRRLRMPPGTLDYHLRRMERLGYLESREVGGYRCLFPCKPLGAGSPAQEKDQILLALLRQRIPRAILLHLTYFGPASGAELSRSVEVSASHLLYYVERLERLGLVERFGEAGGNRKARVVAADRVRELLLSFPPLKESAPDRWLHLWETLRP